MIRKKLYTDGWLAVAMIIGLGMYACGPSSQASGTESPEDPVTVVNVEVMTIELTDFTAFIRVTGEVEAMNDVMVSAEETGVIERFYAEKGVYVRAGAPIAKIRDDVLRAQVEEASAAAQLARERFERQRQLWEEEQIGSEIAYLEAKYQAQLQAARHAYLQARLERTVIRAPISGIFDDRYVDVGEMVSPGSQVARVVEVDRVKVTGGVAERFASTVHPGDSVRINFEVMNEETDGVIEFVGSAVDPRSRTFPIEVVIANPGRVVKPQMVANVLIASRRLQGVVVIPQAALMRTEDGYEVFVVVERDGVPFAEAQRVALGLSYQNQVVVEAGLDVGDRLVVRGQQLVEAGDRVRIVNEDRAEL
jgi:membrane fusion protein (multidrug efflux system)